MTFDKRSSDVVIIFKQIKTVQNVYFWYLEAGSIGYLSFRISEDSELEKWPNYPDLPYYYHYKWLNLWKNPKKGYNKDNPKVQSV